MRITPTSALIAAVAVSLPFVLLSLWLGSDVSAIALTALEVGL